MTLLPGDVVMMGIPPGVGSMKVGDTVEVRIAGIRTLRNKIK
ncbi:MAG: fumarylacetoacetate hydrolase family protein [Actinomycetota bacterium]